MSNEEIELQKNAELLDKDIAFRNELSRYYSDLCYHVYKKKKEF